MNKFILVSVLLLALFFLGVICTNTLHEAQGESHELHLMEKIRQHQSSLLYEMQNTIGSDSAQLLKVHASIPEVANFFTEKRTLGITSFPCSNCHDRSLAAMQANSSLKSKKAHWDIYLDHADESTMNCKTCHAGDKMNQLSSLTGKMIKMDESFKLCGQCHSTQYKDWQGGAHGKQLNGWKPPRIAKTCVSCHNPHQPAFPKRFPARLNTNQLEE